MKLKYFLRKQVKNIMNVKNRCINQMFRSNFKDDFNCKKKYSIKKSDNYSIV